MIERIRSQREKTTDDGTGRNSEVRRSSSGMVKSPPLFAKHKRGERMMCVSHKWESSFAGDRTFCRCKECGDTFSIRAEEMACPKWRPEENMPRN